MFSDDTKRKAILYICQNNPAARHYSNPWEWASDMLEGLIKGAMGAGANTFSISTAGMSILISHRKDNEGNGFHTYYELVLLAKLGETECSG